MSGLKPELPDNLEQLQQHAQFWVDAQKLCLWAIGDIAIKARGMGENALQQVFPVETSPGLIARCEAVSMAYKPEERVDGATWSQAMKLAKDPQRIQKLQEIVDKGLTTDESNRPAPTEDGKPRWLLAVDCNYYLHKHWFSGAGVEAAQRVSEWIRRTVDRLKQKGLTDAVMCFDSRESFRKALTKEWEDKYKDRPPKPPELVQQLHLVSDLLGKGGFRCVTVDGFESDDVMASYAKQFPGRVTIMTADKDLRQCLSDECNILTDVEWEEDPNSGDMLPDYKWLSAKQHTEATGIRPDQWSDLQMLMGDTTDGIKGAPNIGETGAKNIVQEFGSAEAAIQAAKDGEERLLSMRRGKIMAEGLLELEKTLDITRQLVTMRTDCPIQFDTRI